MEGVYVRAGDGGSRVCTYINNFEKGLHYATTTPPIHRTKLFAEVGRKDSPMFEGAFPSVILERRRHSYITEVILVKGREGQGSCITFVHYTYMN